MKPAAAFSLLSALVLAVGCASNTDTHHPPPTGVSDAAFDANANRPPTGETLFALARILEAQGREDESQQLLERIIQNEPLFMPAYNELAEMYVRRNQLNDAAKVIKAGLTRRPDEPVLLNNLGMCWFLQENYADALESFDRAVKAKPTEPTYQANRAAALALLGRYDQATAAYQQVFGRDEDTPWRNMVILARARGLQMERKPASRPALTTQPASDEAELAPAVSRNQLP